MKRQGVNDLPQVAARFEKLILVTKEVDIFKIDSKDCGNHKIKKG